MHASKTSRVDRGGGGANSKKKHTLAQTDRMSRQDGLRTRDLDEVLAQKVEHFVVHHLPTIHKQASNEPWDLSFRRQEERAEGGRNEFFLWAAMPLAFFRKAVFPGGTHVHHRPAIPRRSGDATVER